MKALSVYIHIPFCPRKCLYCNFLSFEHREHFIEPYMEALKSELRQYSSRIESYYVKSIFIGGGTPSILSARHMVELFDVIKSFQLMEETEITIECNPGTLDQVKLEAYRQVGINRISFGLQSTDNSLLKQLGRIHTYEEFLSSYDLARKNGFDNINIDLMFGLSGQSLEVWRDTLATVVSLQPEHISTYGLKIEKETPFFTMAKKNQLVLPSEDLEREMYWTTHNLLDSSGYRHYEISNYAKQDFSSYHNTVYWQVEPYIGVGLGAASLFNGSRYHNTTRLKDYIQAEGQFNLIQQDEEPVTLKSSVEEYMFLGLRMMEGVSGEAFYKKFNVSIKSFYDTTVSQLVEKGLMTCCQDRIKLTKRGIDVSNYVLKEFILD